MLCTDCGQQARGECPGCRSPVCSTHLAVVEDGKAPERQMCPDCRGRIYQAARAHGRVRVTVGRGKK